MYKKQNKMLKNAVIASVLALSVSSPVFADHTGSIEPDYSKPVQIKIGEESLGEGSWYLYYTPYDQTIGSQHEGYAHLKGGNWYVYSLSTPTDSDTSRYYRLIGELGMSEEEMKQAIDDAIHNVEGDQTVDGSQTVTGSQEVQGGQTVTGGQTVNGDATTNGSETVTGNSTVKGDSYVQGDEVVSGNETVKGDSNIGGNQTVTGDSTVKGDEYVHGNETVGEDLTVKGDEYVNGNEVVSGDSTTKGDEYVHGNEVVSGDSTTKGDGTVGGDMNVGYEGVDEDGDGVADRPGNLDVAGDSHLIGDTQVGSRDEEGNVTDYSDFDVTGNTNLGGDTGVGFDGVDEDGDGTPDRYGNLDVAGDTTVGIRDEEGNVEEASDLDVTGNSNLGGDTNIGYDGVDTDGDGVADRPGNLDVAGDSHLTGDTQVGSRDENGNVTDYSNFDVTGSANVGGDAYVGFDGVDADGDGTPDRPGNMYVAGDTVIGVPGVPGAESNLHVTGNTTIDHDLYVGGEGHFDGNLYAPDLIFNGGKSLTGEIDRLDGRIDTAGANAAALAGLHPLDFDEDQKLNFAAAVGSYQGASAMALGMFYRPDDRTMFNLGGTFGNRENMATLGISFALDGPNAVKRSSKKQMQEQIVMLTAANAEMAQDNAEMQAELAELKAMVMEMKAEQTAESK